MLAKKKQPFFFSILYMNVYANFIGLTNRMDMNTTSVWKTAMSTVEKKESQQETIGPNEVSTSSTSSF